MKNATKVLLIVLLIGLIISAFIMIRFNSVEDTLEEAEEIASTQQVHIFNAQFTGYLGAKRIGTIVKNLQTIVSNSNTINTEHQVELIIPAAGIVDNREYKVIATYDGSTGFITKITVK